MAQVTAVRTSSDRLSVMKVRFNSEVTKIRNSSAKNSIYLTEDDYKKLVLEVEEAKTKTKKEPRHYWLLNRYDVMLVENNEKLIYPLKEGKSVIQFYVHNSDLFDVLNEAHLAIGHGGRDRMMKELVIKYKNITRQDVNLYISLCEPCQKKQKGTKKSVVVKPMISSEFNSRCQVDLIDFQSQRDGDYKFILVYQDHLTKFVILKPLKTKTAEEVAYHLLDIFTLIGAPSILQSDNGREFANKVVNNLKSYWPALKIVHGKPRHSQSQGSVERANQDIENMISTWMQDENTDKWSEGLKFVQLMKNRALHSGIRRTPYEALFGCKVKVGLTTSSLPREVLNALQSEEDLERVVNNIQTTEAPSVPSENVEISTEEPVLEACSNEATDEHKCRECFSSLHHACGQDYEGKILCALCFKTNSIAEERKRSKSCLEVQAKKMKSDSDKKFPPAPEGATVRVPIPDVDKGRGDSRNILAVVMNVTDDGFYKLGTTSGVLKQLYSRSQFTVCQKSFVRAEDVPDEETALRTAATSQSSGSGQGFVKCSCITKCQNKKCKCVKEQRKCNSKCHSSLPCCNK